MWITRFLLSILTTSFLHTPAYRGPIHVAKRITAHAYVMTDGFDSWYVPMVDCAHTPDALTTVHVVKSGAKAWVRFYDQHGEADGDCQIALSSPY